MGTGLEKLNPVGLLYHVFVGFPLCVAFMTVGLLLCVTIIGLPVGLALIAAGVKAL
jgi:uncharacterized membrane protein YccF (DUF307 family)